MKKYKIGLVIGRFQPFHKGHLHLLKESLNIADKIIIGIGTANRCDQDNPWTIEERRLMLEKVVKEEKIENRIIKIVDVNDYLNDDERWYRASQVETDSVDIVIGNNDHVRRIYDEHHIQTTGAKLFKRYLLEGYKIRKLIRAGKQWKNRVPEYLIESIRTSI